VVPTRRLILSPPDVRISDLMVTRLVTLPAHATVLDACEFFIQHRLLAFPVVDDDGHLLGVVDVDVFTDELTRLTEMAPVERWVQPLVRFLHVESASGLMLLACAIVALVLANSPWSDAVANFWQTPLGLSWGSFHLIKPLLLWINDGLMTLFFFVVGLEIKREVVAGELSELRKALLPIVAALGGMVAPALVFLAFHWGRPTAVGWAIPTATDIAFVVGFLALLGSRVPHGLKVLLLSLAIADDIGAVLVIAFVYSTNLALGFVGLGMLGFGFVLQCRWIGVRSVAVYVVLGALIWLAFLKSGIHPTVVGVALGLLTPTRAWLGDRQPFDVVTDLFQRFRAHVVTAEQHGELVSPLERLERALHPWVAFGIMPLFALANAGVPVDLTAVGNWIAIAVALGLVLGKPLGIVLFSLAAVRLGLARMPAGVDAKVLLGGGAAAGIGFTMSIFIAGLAFQGAWLDEAKLGILGGSIISAGAGAAILLAVLPKRPSPMPEAKGTTTPP
jgi:NhaA family Na+:H+ antiporter